MELLEKLKGLKDPSDITEETLRAIVDYITKKQWIKDHFPDNEVDVLIIVEHRPFRRPAHRRVVRAFYEDGMQRTEDSLRCWENLPDGIIPMGWYESTDYGESCEISDQVIGWQHLPDPWE